MSIHQHSGILIVDDSVTVRSVVKKILSQLGYQNIDEASDGATALEKISEKHFSLVISDWNMEPMTGFQLLEEIRSNKAHASLCFIMMTADHAISKVVSARHARADCFINKPFRAEELQTKISQASTERRPATAG
jgi:two-component system chemotaxis response regulator CheY